MSEEPERILRAKFVVMDEEIVERVKVITESKTLSTDPNVLADDLQTVAVFARQMSDNVEVLIQVIETIAASGALQLVKKDDPPKNGRF